MSAVREKRSSARPTTNGTKPSSSNPNINPNARRSPPRDGYYAGGEFDENPPPPLTPTSMDGGPVHTSYPGDDIYPSSAGGPSRQAAGAGGGHQMRANGGPVLAPVVPGPAQPAQRVQATRRVQTVGSDEDSKSRPQSYAGSVHRDEYSPTRSGGQPSSSRNGGASGGGHHRRSSNAQRTSASSSAAQPPPNGTRSKQAQVPDDTVSRLESPSIIRSVLQPLEKKMNEYKHLMSETQTELAQLDDQIRALEDRRQRAEERFAEAKGKHDDYERQHHHVGRALTGEADDYQQPTARPLTATRGGGPVAGPTGPVPGGPGGRPFSPTMYQNMHREMTPPHVGFQEGGRPMSGGGNSSRTTQKMRTRDRFRRSLFGRG